MRWRLLLAVVALLCPLAAAGPASAMPVARASGERPPECIRVHVEYNSGAGPAYWWRFCGTGSGGDSPLRDAMRGRALVFDGGPPGPGSVIFGSP